MASPEPIPYYPPQAPLDPHMRTSDGLLAAAAAILERPDAEIDGELRAQAWREAVGRGDPPPQGVRRCTRLVLLRAQHRGPAGGSDW